MSQTQIPAHATIPVTWQCAKCKGKGVNWGACKGKGKVTCYIQLPALITYIQNGLMDRALAGESEGGE